MKKFIVGLLVVLSVFAFMSCTTTTYTEKTVALKSTDGAVATSTVTISADSNADAYVFVGGAYVSVTKNPYTGTYGTLTAVKKNSDWTVNYVGGTTAGKETINVYIGTTTGAVMDKSSGTIIANCEAAISAKPEPEPEYIELSIVAGSDENTDASRFEVDIDVKEPNAIGVFVDGYWYGDFCSGTKSLKGGEVTLCDSNNVEVATLTIENVTDYNGDDADTETYAEVTLAGIDDQFGTIDGEIIAVDLATYYVASGVKVIKDVYDSFEVKASVYGVTIFRLDNVVNTSKTVTSKNCKAYYKLADGTYAEITSEFSESTPMVGTLGFLTFEYDGSESEGDITFIQSSSKVVGTGSLEVYFGVDTNKTCYGHATVLVNTLKAVEAPMTGDATDPTVATYTYIGDLSKSIAKYPVTIYKKESGDSKWVEFSNSATLTGYFKNSVGGSLGDVTFTQHTSGTAVVKVKNNTEDVGAGSCQLVFGYKTQGENSEFIPTDWLKLTHTF